MSDVMTFPATFEEFAKSYKIVDSKQVYTNGTELIPIFRVEQWLEHKSTLNLTENDKEIKKALECGFVCDRDYWESEDCEFCSAKEYCGMYEEMVCDEDNV